ncbi:MAG TPA: BMP family protein [Acetobacteraceae bacterium]|nr:BMP family protein [Acetobacteraceae bacterium]
MKTRLARLALAALLATPLTFAAARAADVTSLAIMTPEQPTDYGWNQQGYDAAKAVAKKYGLKFTGATGLGYGDVRATLRELADDKVGLIIAHASGYNTAAAEIADETKTRVAIVDSPNKLKPGLIADYTLSGHEGAYLAGMLAAKMTRSDTVAIVVSGEPPAWNAQSYGFATGVHATNPKVKIRYAVIGPAAYSDAAGAKRVTDAAIAAGADVVFGEGDGASFGMIQAVETARPANGGKVWFIDVIGDKSSIDHGNLLSSVVWDYTPVFDQMIQDIKSDKFGTHDYHLSLASGSVRLLHTSHVPADIWQQLMQARAEIIAGKIKVPEVFDAQKVRQLMTAVDAGK